MSSWEQWFRNEVHAGALVLAMLVWSLVMTLVIFLNTGSGPSVKDTTMAQECMKTNGNPKMNKGRFEGCLSR